jgi:CHAT domain-containing protein
MSPARRSLLYNFHIPLMRWFHGPSALLACLALLGADRAGASPPPELSECEERLSRFPGGEEMANCLADLAWNPGPAQVKAHRRLEELVETRPDIPWFGIQLGLLQRKSAPADAERLYRRSIRLSADRRLARAEVYARCFLGKLLQDTKRVDEAAAELKQALQVARASGDGKAIAKAAIAQATLSIFQGNLEQAYADLAGVDTPDDDDLQRLYLFKLADAALQTGRFKEARDAYLRLLALSQKTGEISVTASARAGLASTRMQELSELPSAEGREEVIELLRETREATRAARRPDLEVNALWMIGSLSGDATEAVAQLERCLEVAPTQQFQIYCQATLARRLAPTDPEAAEDAIGEAMTLAREAGDVLGWVAAWHERMRMSWALGPDRGLRDSWAALDAIEALRDLQRGSSGQPRQFSTWAEDYYWLSGRLLELGRQEDAFRVIERMRARTLTDALGLPRRGPALPPSTHARRAELALAIAQVQRRLMGGGLSEEARAKASASLHRLEADADRIRMQIQRADPALAGSRQPGFASLEQVRRNLGSDEALLSFQVAPQEDLAGDYGGGAWLLVSTRADTRIYPLADRAELRRNVNTFVGMFEARDGSEADVAAVLYSKLLEPALAELSGEIRKLVIVPDDALNRLPFAALRQKPEGKPLVFRYQISLVPSATLWLRWRQDRSPAVGKPALVYADPPPTASRKAVERGAAFRDPANLGELPMSRDEGESVLRHLGGGSLLLTRAEASEARLKSGGAEGFRIVHFATHSWTDDVAPEHSYVYLDPGSPEQDGLLQPREIADLVDLEGRTVVLSTCESARGEILRGEGVMGLARSFFQAGAHTVVASLRRLRDEDGAALFDRFYAYIAEGKSVAAALQGAQLDLIEDDQPAAAWAGVVVLGDGDRVPMPGGRPGLPRFTLPVAAGAVAALALIAALARRRTGQAGRGARDTSRRSG